MALCSRCKRCKAADGEPGLNGKQAGLGRQGSGRARGHQPCMELGPVVPERRAGGTKLERTFGAQGAASDMECKVHSPTGIWPNYPINPGPRYDLR